MTYIACDGNEHEVLAWPNVEMIWRDPESMAGVFGILPWGNLELAPQGVDVLLLVVHTAVLHHVVAHGGVGAVGADHEIEVDLDLLCATRGFGGTLDLEPGPAGAEVGAGQLVVEEEAHVGHALEDVKQALIEPGPVNGEDGLGRTCQHAPGGG